MAEHFERRADAQSSGIELSSDLISPSSVHLPTEQFIKQHYNNTFHAHQRQINRDVDVLSFLSSTLEWVTCHIQDTNKRNPMCRYYAVCCWWNLRYSLGICLDSIEYPGGLQQWDPRHFIQLCFFRFIGYLSHCEVKCSYWLNSPWHRFLSVSCIQTHLRSYSLSLRVICCGRCFISSWLNPVVSMSGSWPPLRGTCGVCVCVDEEQLYLSPLTECVCSGLIDRLKYI